jgi:hypothetical protein
MWISASKAAERLGVGRSSVARIADAAGIRRRQLPGQVYPYYDSDDIDRVARESVVGDAVVSRRDGGHVSEGAASPPADQ